MGKAEAKVESYLDKKVREVGGITRKWVSPGRAGVPDRICFFPNGLITFVEVKKEGGKVSKRQEKELETLRHLGAMVYVVYSKQEVDYVLEHIN